MGLLTDFTGQTIPPATAEQRGTISAQTTSAEKTLGTLIWSGTTGFMAPGGTVDKKYFWTMNGRQVTLSWKIKATTGGVLITSVSTPLPDDLPPPMQFTDQEMDEWVYMGSGAILAARNSANDNGATCGIYKDATGSLLLKVNSGSVSLGAKFAKGIVTYLTGG